MKITPTILRQVGACSPALAKFTELFPEGVTITRELCRKHAQDFDFGWAANRLLRFTGYRAYEKAANLAYHAYTGARLSAQQPCEETQDAYEQAMTSAGLAYDEALAVAFADAALKWPPNMEV